VGGGPLAAPEGIDSAARGRAQRPDIYADLPDIYAADLTYL
jgi:hypothetical protein